MDVRNTLAICASGAAVLISLFSVWITRRSIITTAVSSNRIDWVSTVRELLSEFIAEYSGEHDNAKLLNIYGKLVLYFNLHSDVYSGLVNDMKQCINHDYCQKTHWSLLSNGQAVLDSSWKRMKREAGIAFWRERYNSWRFKKERKKLDSSPYAKWSIDINTSYQNAEESKN